MEYSLGQEIIYDGHPSVIEEEDNGEYKITNPAWEIISEVDGDHEADETVPYWIWVSKADLDKFN